MTDEPKTSWHQLPEITMLDEVHVLLYGKELDLKRFWTTQMYDQKYGVPIERRRIYIELKDKEQGR